MITLLIIITITIIAYLLLYTKKYGLPESFSATYGVLDNRGWVFQIGCYLIAVAMMCIHSDILMIMACSSMIIAITKIEGREHNIAAISCGVLAILWLLLQNGWWILLIAAVIGFLFWKKYSKWCLWLELSIAYSVIVKSWIILIN